MVMATQGSRWTARLSTTTDTGRPPPGMSPENSATRQHQEHRQERPRRKEVKKGVNGSFEQ